jgi:general secretion pathway protein C
MAVNLSAVWQCRHGGAGRSGQKRGWLNHNVRMKPRLFAFVVWALVAGSVMFWGLRLLVNSSAMPAHAVSVADSSAATGDVARLLGTTPQEVAATTAPAPVSELSTRFKLTGVMSPKSTSHSNSGQGVALISVDGKPARAFGVGSRIDGDLRLQAVSLRTASIGSGPGKAPVVLEMPPLAPPNTGSLPSTSSFQGMGGAGANAGVTPPAVPAATGTVPRGIPFNPASLAAKPPDGLQQTPAPPQPTMQSNNQPSAQ